MVTWFERRAHHELIDEYQGRAVFTITYLNSDDLAVAGLLR